MDSEAHAKISCSACGKQFRWKQELAGRKVRCTCSQVMTMPMTPPVVAGVASPSALASSRGEQEYELDTAPRQVAQSKCPACNQPVNAGAVICVKCGFHIAEGQRMKTAVHQDDAAAADARVYRDDNVSSGRMLAAQAVSGHRAQPDDGDQTMQAYRFQEFYLPIGLLLFGMVFILWRNFLDANNVALHWTFMAAIEMAAQIIIMLPLMLATIFITAKLMDISYGALHTALLKIAAIAIGPMALADLVIAFIASITFGCGVIFLYSAIYLVCVAPFLAALFDLDYFETIVTLVAMVLVRFFFSFAILIALFSIFG